MSVLIFIDQSEGNITKSSIEAASYGVRTASKLGLQSTAILFGNVSEDECKKIGKYGVTNVLVNSSIQEFNAMQMVKSIIEVVEKNNITVIIFSQDYSGKTIAPIISSKLKAGYVSGAVDFPNTDEGFIVKKNVFSGKAFANVKINTDRKIISILPNSIGFKEQQVETRVKTIESNVESGRVKIIKIKKKVSDGMIPLTEADIVVSGGRGLKGPENWGIIEELAKELGATTACSRPVADIGWRPHHEHVGQTGIAIRPNLYIAIGISGAIQHIAGVNGSKVIVVINIDPEAPFFKSANYGIIGDAFEIVPKLTKAIRNFKSA